MRIRRIAALSVGAVATGLAAWQVAGTRYRTGEAQLRQILRVEDGVLVVLYRTTFLAPADQEPAFKAFAEGDLVPYRVDTWRRGPDGSLRGAIGVSKV